MTNARDGGAMPLQQNDMDGRSNTLAQRIRLHAPEHDAAGTGGQGQELSPPPMTVVVEQIGTTKRITITL